MHYKKFLINCYTNWCGEDNTYAAIAEKEEDIQEFADLLAYENFESFGGFDAVLQDMFPEVENEEYTDKQQQEAAEAECGFYGYTIEEFDETGDQEWDWFELVYDASSK